MLLYLSGPMSYRKDHNHSAFYNAASHLGANGFEVVNPAALDEGQDTTGWLHRDYLKRDIQHLLLCDGVATVGNWHTSHGARAEVELAMALRLPVMTWAEWLHDYEPGGVTP